ncbi:alpha/beta fold hydrolase [Schlesneria paludicola]|uniref:alpha/beta fold hydrolase n=1 Tax=Schlesneria paludicola TaxID=360056 RepID=UPI00029A53AA|nr:alpha/beta hydrolase [Schlesneria paludicola]
MYVQTNETGKHGHQSHLQQAVTQFLTPRSLPPTPRDEELLRRGMGLNLSCGLAATAWGTGPTILLAHGWESRRTHWGAFVPSLIETGFRVIAVDAPAHADSPGTQVSVFDYAQALAGVGREIGPLSGVVGHSFGAAAAAFALHLGLDAERAVLISGPASLTAVIERWGRHHGMSEDEIPTFVRLVAERTEVPLKSLDLAHVAVDLKQPALIIHDRGDDDIPLEDALALVAAWPRATLVVTERFGHRRILIAKEVVKHVVHFLKDGYNVSDTV